MYECVYGAHGDRKRIFAASGVAGTCELPYEVLGTEPRCPQEQHRHLAISTGSGVTLVKSTSQSSEASLSWLVVLGPMCDYLESGLSFLLFILFLT